MEIKSINIGKIQHYKWGRGISSAIHKFATSEPVYLTTTGIKGDEQADLKNHGGEDKAVLIIPADNYPFFDVTNPFGFLGENLTISGLDERKIQIGDQLVINEVILEVTQPRSPCAKLGEIVARKDFVKKYSNSGRVGFYCRVLKEGDMQTNTAIKLIKTAEKSVSIVDLFLSQFVYEKKTSDLNNIKIALATTTLSAAWRAKLSKIK